MLAESLIHILEVAYIIIPGGHVYPLADWKLKWKGRDIAQWDICLACMKPRVQSPVPLAKMKEHILNQSDLHVEYAEISFNQQERGS